MVRLPLATQMPLFQAISAEADSHPRQPGRRRRRWGTARRRELVIPSIQSSRSSLRVFRPRRPSGTDGDLVPGFDAALGHIDVLVHARRQIALAIRQGARIVGKIFGPSTSASC